MALKRQLPNTYGNGRNKIDLIILQGDLNRGVGNQEIIVELPDRTTAKLVWAGPKKNGKFAGPLGTFIGDKAFTGKNGLPNVWGTFTYQDVRKTPFKQNSKKKDNMLWWSPDMKKTVTNATVLPFTSPVSDHMMLRGTFTLKN